MSAARLFSARWVKPESLEISHACRLRHKLAARGDRYIVNVWGVGYRLIDGPLQEARERSLGAPLAG